jgi:predicted glycoside hydrolase/deacetylase ChbG (UPF0249 family)
MECDPPAPEEPVPPPYPPAPEVPVPPPYPPAPEEPVPPASDVTGTLVSYYDEMGLKEYYDIKTELVAKLHDLHLEKQHLIEQQKDATFIDKTIANFESFMCEQLHELETLLAAGSKKSRKKVTTKKK